MPNFPENNGVVLAEIFTMDNSDRQPHGPWLHNLSGRAPLRTGDGVLIGGFVIEGDQPQRVLLRGVGPGLVDYGVGDAAHNPLLELHQGLPTIAANDDWSSTGANRDAVEAAQRETGAFPLVRGSTDAALVADLSPGIYTVIVRSDDPADVDRIALVEVYALDAAD